MRLQTAVVETCVSMHSCSDTPGRAMMLGIYAGPHGEVPLVAQRSATPGAKSMSMGGPVRNESHHGPGLS